MKKACRRSKPRSTGAEQIGFTIVSLTVSLIAVLIPLLFMGDVVGRLFREFAVTLAVTIIISAVVSLTLTPMMCSRILRHDPEEKQTRFYRWSERVFNSMIEFYGRTLRVVLRFQTLTLLVAAATLVLTVVLYIVIPKGFFPVQDTGVIQGISQAFAIHLLRRHGEKQHELAQIILQDPAVESLSSFIGADGINTTLNSGRISINLKPLDERISASDVIRRLQTQPAAGARHAPLHAAGAGHHGGRSREPHAVPVHARRSRHRRVERVDQQVRGATQEAARTGRRGHRSADRRQGRAAGRSTA